MSLTKKSPQPAKAAADPQDEIEQIMSEIELLQKEIGEVDAGAPAAPVTVTAAAPAPTERPKPTLVKTETAAPAPVAEGPSVQTSVVDTDPLEEFRANASAGEPSLEDTLADLRDEGGAGRSILDEVEDEPQIGELPTAKNERDRALAQATREVEEAFDKVEEDRSLEELHEEVTHAQAEEEEMPDQDENKAGDGSLSMTLRGNMTLKLQYEIEGQVIAISFSDQSMRVQLADGTEFKIPMRNRGRRAA